MYNIKQIYEEKISGKLGYFKEVVIFFTIFI